MATQVATEQGSDIATAHGLPPLRLAARELRRGLCEFGQVPPTASPGWPQGAPGSRRIAYSDIPQDGALMPPAPPQAGALSAGGKSRRGSRCGDRGASVMSRSSP